MKISVLAPVLLALTVTSQVFATDIARVPLTSSATGKANVIFGLDDSASMDFETLLDTSDGALWWNKSSNAAWDASGKALFNLNGLPDSTWAKFAYLFPNGCEAGARTRCDASSHLAIPPTPQFAPVRSNAYNPLFYDPNVTYRVWDSAKIDGKLQTFSNSTPSAAKMHPLYPDTLDLTRNVFSQDDNWTFTAFEGMSVPSGSRVLVNKKWVALTRDVTIGQGDYPLSSYTVAISYAPSTYWNKEACTVNGTTCVRAPDGATLKRYVVATDSSFPSGRSQAEELQNFANWFTYYRKRHLMLSASMGQVLNSVTGIRLGVVPFNYLKVVRMYGGENSTDPKDQVANLTEIIGDFYSNAAQGGTPTRETLRHVGEQFRTNRSVNNPEQCVRNAAFIVTDGFAQATTVSVPRYNKKDFGSGAPYATTHNGTLADLALAYYSMQPPDDGTNAGAKKLQMNTYALTLGARGNLWPRISDPYAQPISWVNPTRNYSPDSIDDLWHATINGRGRMFLATTPEETAAQMQQALIEIQTTDGAQGGVTFSTLNLKPTNAYAYVGSYAVNGWTGDILAYGVDAATGEFSQDPVWSAAQKLNARDWNTRKIVTFKNGAGVAFTAANIGSSLGLSGSTSATEAVAYLRGSRANEPRFRSRKGLMGAVLNAEPVVHPGEGVVYAASNEGMLHALDSATGEELWAYVLGFVLGGMGAQLNPAWQFQTNLDATPALAKVGNKTLLVGNRGSAGPGVYALDVTDPKSLDTEAKLAERVKWEFPAANASTELKKSVGVSLGKPVVVQTSSGPVVLVSSGYNSTQDGRGRVFVLNANTGELIKTLVTTAGSNKQDSGLGPLSGFAEPDGTVRFAYAGDELGNLWRFDVDSGSVFLLTTLKDKNNVARPITAAPELARQGGRRMVFVGTGRLLHGNDFTDVESSGALVTHSFYAIWDNNVTVTNRNQLAPRSVTVEADGTRQVSGEPVNWKTQRGWYVDLPAGERANTDPAMGAGVIGFTTNRALASDCTVSSALYVANAETGLRLADNAFDVAPYYGVGLGNTLSARVVLSRLTTNKLGVTTRQSDGTETVRTLNIEPARRPAKTSWREVLR